MMGISKVTIPVEVVDVEVDLAEETAMAVVITTTQRQSNLWIGPKSMSIQRFIFHHTSGTFYHWIKETAFVTKEMNITAADLTIADAVEQEANCMGTIDLQLVR